MPDPGRVRLAGEDTSRLARTSWPNRRLRQLGYVFQFHFLLAEFTVRENVTLPMRRLGRLDPGRVQCARGRTARALWALPTRPPSGRTSCPAGSASGWPIARALANDPLVLLADEPTGNLDSVSSANVRQILRELTRETGKSVVAVTHDAQLRRRRRPPRADRRRAHPRALTFDVPSPPAPLPLARARGEIHCHALRLFTLSLRERAGVRAFAVH